MYDAEAINDINYDIYGISSPPSLSRYTSGVATWH